MKLEDREKSFETDISVENWCSVKNAFLLRCYSACDPRVKPLVMVVKLWAQRAGITDARLKRLAGIVKYKSIPTFYLPLPLSLVLDQLHKKTLCWNQLAPVVLNE